MSWRGTLLLVLLAGLAVIFLFFSGRSVSHPPEQSLLDLDPMQADQIEIRESGSLLTLTNRGGEWLVQAQLKSNNTTLADRANPQLVHSLLETVADITPLDILRSSDLKGAVTLASLGLKKSNRSITIIRAGKKETLSLGVEGAAPGSLYAQLDAGKTVYLIDGKVASLAFRPIVDYRDPRLKNWNSDQVTEVNITKGDALQQLKLAKNPKEGNVVRRGWFLTSPISAKGDNQAISAWLNALLGSQIIRWITEETAPLSCGLETPATVVTLKGEGSENALILKVGAPVPDSPGSYFVQCNDRTGICVVGGAIPATLAITPQTLRSPKINQVDFDTVDRIEIGHFYFTRKTGGEDWIGRSEGETNFQVIHGEQMKQWYGRLEGLSALRFEAATPEHLTHWGLAATNQPIAIHLIAILSENTAQENAGQTVLAEYHFGSTVQGEVALRQGESSELMILPASAVEFLKTFTGEVQSPPIGPDQIKR